MKDLSSILPWHPRPPLQQPAARPGPGRHRRISGAELEISRTHGVAHPRLYRLKPAISFRPSNAAQCSDVRPSGTWHLHSSPFPVDLSHRRDCRFLSPLSADSFPDLRRDQPKPSQPASPKDLPCPAVSDYHYPSLSWIMGCLWPDRECDFHHTALLERKEPALWIPLLFPVLPIDNEDVVSRRDSPMEPAAPNKPAGNFIILDYV